jgi:hypothetical protein
MLISVLANSHIFEISEDDHPRLVTHANDDWWTLEFANAYLSPGVNSRAEFVPSPRVNVRNGVPHFRALGSGKMKIATIVYKSSLLIRAFDHIRM